MDEKEVSTHEFSTKTYKYLDKEVLPITITKYGKPAYRLESVIATPEETSEENVAIPDKNVATSEAGFGKSADDFIEQTEEEDWGVCEGNHCNNPANTKIRLIGGKVLKVCGKCRNRAEQEDVLDTTLEEK